MDLRAYFRAKDEQMVMSEIVGFQDNSNASGVLEICIELEMMRKYQGYFFKFILWFSGSESDYNFPNKLIEESDPFRLSFARSTRHIPMKGSKKTTYIINIRSMVGTKG